MNRRLQCTTETTVERRVFDLDPAMTRLGGDR